MLWPDNESKVDLLNYQSISNAIVKLLRDQQRLPVSIGIHGDWGAGKSTVLSMIENSYKEDEKTVCVRFNSWLYQGLEDAQTALMQQITTDLIKNRAAIEGFKESADSFLKRVDWFKTAKTVANWGVTAFTGIPMPGTMQDLSTAIDTLTAKAGSLKQEDITEGLAELKGCIGSPKNNRVVTEVTEFREEYEKLLKAADIDRLVILVDDLDRCLPDTAIATMEAMKLFLFMPNTAFIVAADETMIEYSVRRHFPNLSEEVGGMAYTRNYLEKLIQIPFRIPPLNENETSIYLALLIAESLCSQDSNEFNRVLEHARSILKKPWAKGSITIEQFESVTGKSLLEEEKELFFMASQIAPALNLGTKGNPRQIKRFLNAFMTRLLVAESAGFKEAIKENVLIKLMLLERFNPNAYEILRLDSLSNPEGKPHSLKALEEPDSLEAQEGSNAAVPATQKLLFDVEKDDWLGNWVKIEPALSDIKLAPYFFLTREKVKFIGLAQSSELIERALKLLSGEALIVAGAQSTVEQLSSDDADKLMDLLITKIQSTSSAPKVPEYYHGAILLCKCFKDLQLKLLKGITEIPERKIGTWAVSGWERAELTEEARKELNELLKDWSESENKILAATANQQLKKDK
ncbi:Qat anti-phage system ATPase QatA [Vibrio europaeus]|uniref:KAP P-loop n=1 Tax=Vibrio europaeus TaxID=300876 RepID=A0A178J4R4_9VIBR|nr:Qat anti-phage system ATPase QatA [Vibrio europaeus]MDC5706166.1 P-loop NTPase fold protein [Vibrio europaeus]MDC5709576.1 KAP family NTPase [Vibrio europaeus]MDC5713975.1 KAP family NTPase [Vibrio europaeus]MDC5723416.1 KAP family NTPase [Vibrio europaeus]MDC5730553.1 KAP family NTPase [Vibrio europaeus]